MDGSPDDVAPNWMMITALESACVCGSIGNTEGIRLCELCHRYWHNDQEFTSVTTIIGKVWPEPSTFENAPIHTVEHARHRGERLDFWACQYAANNGVVDVDDNADIVESVEIFDSWWRKVKPGYIDHQRIVFDTASKTAGKLDLLLNIDGKAAIVDLKRTWQPEQTWPVQLGGYRTNYHRTPKPEQLLIDEVGALHIHPRFKHGFIYRKYDPEKVSEYWDSTVRFWKTVQALTA